MSYRIATRYAKSLIELAQEKGKLEEVYKDIQQLESVIKSSTELRVFLKSPIVSADKKIAVLNKVFSKLNEITAKFITLLAQKGREGFLVEITESFVIQYNQLKNITPINITSAVKLDKSTIDTMLSDLKKRESLGDIQLTETIDESLLGGFVLLYGDKQIDSSVRTSLQKLRNLVEDDSYVKNIR
ncbi:MAG: synthase subunit delta [Bacteroidetes bacterium]|nr:synthase subunit delta [Bacteroidota bacterium]